jgi:hypothetical protein
MLLPMAGLAIGLVQTTAGMLPKLGAQVSAVVLAAVAVFETLGPPLVAYALRLAGEVPTAAEEPVDVTAPAPIDPDYGTPGSSVAERS